MQHIVAYLDSGKPIVGIRTATHAFNIKPDKTYAKYSYDAKDEAYRQGFGRQILGETWISHHGKHGSQSTRGILVKEQASHPILRGLKDGDIWGPSDVYGVRLPLPGDSTPLVLGQVLTGMNFDDSPLEGAKNDPMMPIAWTKTYTGSAGNQGRVFCSTIGAATDLATEGTRRLLVNACYWAAGLEDKIPASSDVSLVGKYQPTNFKFNGFLPGVKPEEHTLR
jgi:type 1 glutamine amidotransferase